MKFRMLGPLVARHDGRDVALGGPKQRTVLALLLVAANKVVSTDRLIDELYGDQPPDAARKSLQSYVANLRRAVNIEQELLQGRSPGYVLEVESSQVDALAFEGLVHQAQALLAGRNPAAARDRLTEALGLWYGTALVDVADEAPSLRHEVTKLNELRLTAMEHRVEADLALGRHDVVSAELASLIAGNPLRERLWGQLMLAQYRSGRQADALRTYQKARRVLGEGLGIEPSPFLRDLESRILAQDATLDVSAPQEESVKPDVGGTIRGYELRERLREGRLGVVYRAFQPAMGREIALEVVRPEVAAGADFARRFEADAAQIARLEHPYLLPPHDYWRDPSGAFLVSRWVRGGDLRTSVGRGAWRVDAVARLVDEVGSALSIAHRCGVVHGSVTFESIQLDEDDHAYLGDFSIGSDRPPGDDDARADICALALVALGALIGEPNASAVPAAVPDGVPAAVLGVLRRAVEPTGRGFVDMAEFVGAFLASTAEHPATAATEAPKPTNPYKGLRPFGEVDAPDFFGREALTERLVARLDGPEGQRRFLAVVGPSGSGKSSAVRAGLIPAIRRGALVGSAQWFVVEMLPGSAPWEELEAALLRIAVNPPASLLDQLSSGPLGLHRAVKRVLPDQGASLVLIIDQFEELFALVDDEKVQTEFMDAIVAAVRAPNSQLRIVITLRADFYDRPLRHAGMSDLVTTGIETVRPLLPQELQRAVAGPAERVGVGFEPGLEARIAADVSGQPGALPLLQYTLTQLFAQRQGTTLTLDGYASLGGVEGALGQQAEQLYADLDRSAQAAAQQLFLRLVAVGEGMSDTRRRVLRSELTGIEGQRAGVEAVLETFGDHRLLSFDRDPVTRNPTVEVAHEALLRAWPRLGEWIDLSRVDLGYEKALRAAATEWQAAGRDSSYLMRGGWLRRFESWHETSRLALTQLQRAFLEASLEARAELMMEEEERRRREASLERRSRTRLRLLVGVLAVATAVAVSLTLIARNQTSRAERNFEIATARGLTASSIQAMDVNPELGLLLAIEAADTTLAAGEAVLSETVEALHRSILANRKVVTFAGGSGAFSADGSRFVAADPGTIFAGGTAEGGARVYSLSGEELLVLRGHAGRTVEAIFSPDGMLIATTGLDGTARLWDAASGTEMYVLEATGVAFFGADFSRDGRVLAVGGSDNLLRLVDAGSGAIETLDVPEAVDVSLSGNDLVAVAADMAGVLVFDRSSGELLFQLTGHQGGVCRVEFSPDDTMLASSSQDGTTRLWDVATGDELRVLAGHAGPVCGMAFSPDGTQLATGGEDGTARVWDVITGEESLVVPGHTAGIGGVAFDPTGRLLATAGGDGLTKIWDVGPEGSREVVTVGTDGLATFSAYGADGTLLATATDDGAVAIWDAATGERLATPAGHTDRVADGDFSPDGALLATASEDQTVRVWEVASADQVFSVTEHVDAAWSAEFSPDGTILATGGLDGLVGLWDASNGREIARLEGIPAAFSVTFSPNGSLIAAVGLGIHVWDVETGLQLAEIEGHTGAILDAEFSPDGRLLATAGADGSAKLWDVGNIRNGDIRELRALEGHSAVLLTVTFSRDGTRIATAALDNTVKVWDLGGTPLLTLPVRTPGVVAFDPTGTRLAVPSADGSVRVYLLAVDELLDLARTRVSRTFTAAECDLYLLDGRCRDPDGPQR